MGTDTLTRLDLPELNRRLRAADPAALLVRPRLLRRIIKQHHQLPGIGLQVPHRKTYVLGREELLTIVEREELELAPGQELPATVLLLAQPDAERLARRPPEQVLRKFWRLLFHAAVHRTLEGRGEKAAPTDAAVCERLHQLGPLRIEEIRCVLNKESFLFPDADKRAIYTEFAAVYLELRYFAPALLPYYFPSLRCHDEIDALLARDLDVAALLAHCRPEGASYPDPSDLVEAPEATEDLDIPETTADLDEPAAPLAADARERLLTQAEQAAGRGNTVKAAILRRQTGQEAGDLDRLAGRLRDALRLDDAEAAEWRQALEPLLGPAAHGVWPAERRLLYDLQKACIDHEKDVYALDVVEWIVSFGKKPIKRKLPYQGLVLQIRNLRGALRRLRSVRLADAERIRLANLLQRALHHAEERLRTALRPTLECELDLVGMRPTNLPERIARQKLVEELLDRVVVQRYLTMGDLRDAVSRNNLKFPDLSGPGEFLRGDRLILANRRLAIALDGIYHRGEIYLRWLQRFSALAFGTPVGRFITLYFALPFGGAYVILEGLQHLIGLATRFTIGYSVHILPHTSRHESMPPDQRLELAGMVGAVGLLLLLLLHVPRFRAEVLHGFKLAGRGLRWLFYELPVRIRNLPAVRYVLESRAYALFARYLLRPLAAAGLAALLSSLLGCDWPTTLFSAGCMLAGTLVLFNSRVVRDLEEMVVDWLARVWRHVHVDLLPGLFRLVINFFRVLVDGVNRGLYTVDEWLRFRAGDRTVWLYIKPVLGLIWFLVTYVARFSINLLIEPQINPIKHFPVVTVSHKLVLALIVPPLAQSLAYTFDLPNEEAVGMATVIGFGIPGIFGFLAWELKENWKLYQANRPKTLRPQNIGHHGETMARFFRPGFHSGTVPKLYDRLRKAARRHKWSAFARNREGLHHVEQAIRHLVERELVALLEESHVWGPEALDVSAVRLGASGVILELSCPDLGATPLVVRFEVQAGWLLAGVTALGWAASLPKERRGALKNALAGLYKLAGVHLVCEQVEACFPAPVPRFGVRPAGLEMGLWSPTPPIVYDLEERPLLHPRRLDGSEAAGWPTLEPARVLFSERAIPWDEWVCCWEADQKGERCGIVEMADVRLLPLRTQTMVSRER